MQALISSLNCDISCIFLNNNLHDQSQYVITEYKLWTIYKLSVTVHEQSTEQIVNHFLIMGIFMGVKGFTEIGQFALGLRWEHMEYVYMV